MNKIIKIIKIINIIIVEITREIIPFAGHMYSKIKEKIKNIK